MSVPPDAAIALAPIHLVGTPDPLPVIALRRGCDPASLPFETTAELQPPDGALGQRRAIDALRVGAELRRPGFNVFVLGTPGLGRHTIVRELLERRAIGEPTPPDWCYVHDFTDPHRPRALCLPSGRATPLKQDVERLVEELQVALPALLEGDEYRARHQAIAKELEQRREEAFRVLGEKARECDVALVRTPTGLVIAPLRRGRARVEGQAVGEAEGEVEDRVLEPAEFAALPEEQQARLKASMIEMGDELQALLALAPAWAREHRSRVRDLRRQMTQAVVEHHFAEVRVRYLDLPEVLAHLDVLARELVENVHEFASSGDGEGEMAAAEALRRLFTDGSALHRYRINVVVEHAPPPLSPPTEVVSAAAPSVGAPVVYEDRPSLGALVGRVEYVQRFGALSTDVTQIKPGALHRANGGYLILDARKVLQQPCAWDELKRALGSRLIRIENVGDLLGLGSTTSLQPQPIPLDVKVVLVGERILYYLLAERDPDFVDLFKIEADFEDDVERDDGAQLAYAQLISVLARRHGARPLDRGAVARMIEQGARLAGDAGRLSTSVRDLGDLAVESDHLAGQGGRAVITASDVEAAIEAVRVRGDRVRTRVVDEIRRGTILIDTAGRRVGCVNGLSVAQLGRTAFGRPTRITARVRPGRGEVVDIEREVELGGPLHSKGVLILSGFLAARYAADAPFTLSASLVFEQSYGGVEGDSASAAELFALLSALAEAPLAQGLAVTGSVNQHGEVQAIGGVNEKIEGFFEVCRARGLTGDQGVLIPAANVRHLMLRAEVVEAAAAGRFRVFPYATVDEGLALLAGVAAGARDAAGRFPEGCLNARVEARLRSFAEVARAFTKGP